MHHHTMSLKALAFGLAFALLTSFGLTSPHQLEAKDSQDKASTKLELKKKKLKHTNKQQVEEAKPAEAPKAPEVKPEPVKPAPPPAPVTPDKKKYASPNGHQVMTDGREVNFRSMGVIYMHGYKYSYYSSKVLYHYRTPEWYACDDHLYRTADGYIVVACRDRAMGSIVPTPFGPGKVLDTCSRNGVIDIYVNF